MKKVILSEIQRNSLLFIISNVIFVVFMFTIRVLGELVDMDEFVFYILFCTFIMICTYLIYNFSYNKKKVSADYYFSLPVTKSQLFLGKYIVTVSAIILTMLIMMVSANLFSLIDVNIFYPSSSSSIIPASGYGQFTLDIFTSMITAVSLFNIMLLFYYYANSVLDGVAYLVALGFIPMLFMRSIVDIIYLVNSNSISMMDFSIYSMFFSWFLDGTRYIGDRFLAFNYTFAIIFTVISFFSIIYTYYLASKDSAERIEEIDNRWFGYKVFTPLICILTSIIYAANMLLLSDNGIFTLIVLGLGVIQFITYIINDKTLRISKEHRYTLLGTIVLNVLICLIL